MLDLGLVLALAQSCAPMASPATLAAIAHVESRFDPLAIGVNREGVSPPRPRSAAEATRVARTLIRDGFNIDLGLAQINSTNLGWLGLRIEDAFDPCRNLAAAGRVLQVGYRPRDNSDAERQRALRVALSRYNTGHAARGFTNGYVAKVERAAASLSQTRVVEATVAPSDLSGLERVSDAPAGQPAPWDVFAQRPSTTLVFTVRSEIHP